MTSSYTYKSLCERQEIVANDGLLCLFPGWLMHGISTNTKDSDRILKFFKRYNKVVIKPLNGYAGKGIFFINSKFNKKKIITYLKKTGHVMVQKFLPKVSRGDKRVFIINGKVMGVIRSVPSKNSILSNLSQGGTAIKTSLNLQEKKISKNSTCFQTDFFLAP